MDIQFWIWLIIIVITLIARAGRQKPKPAPRQDDEGRGADGQPQRGPMTFEDLLREIQAAKEIRETPTRPQAPAGPYRQPEPTYQEVDYDDNIGEEEEDLETIVDDQRTSDIYERAKQQAFSRPSLEETLRLEDTEVKFGKFKGYGETEEEKHPLAGVLAELKDPDGFRKAFIMSEILTRKY